MNQSLGNPDTNINMAPYCQYHAEHHWRLQNGEAERSQIWKEINTMKGWVIAGAGSTILTFLMIILQVVFKRMGLM